MLSKGRAKLLRQGFPAASLRAALAGAISRTVTAPVDRLKMIMQVDTQRGMTLREGVARMTAEGAARCQGQAVRGGWKRGAEVQGGRARPRLGGQRAQRFGQGRPRRSADALQGAQPPRGAAARQLRCGRRRQGTTSAAAAVAWAFYRRGCHSQSRASAAAAAGR